MYCKEYIVKVQVESDAKQCNETTILSKIPCGHTGLSNRIDRIILTIKLNVKDQNKDLHLSSLKQWYIFNKRDNAANANPANPMKNMPIIFLFFWCDVTGSNQASVKLSLMFPVFICVCPCVRNQQDLIFSQSVNDSHVMFDSTKSECTAWHLDIVSLFMCSPQTKEIFLNDSLQWHSASIKLVQFELCRSNSNAPDTLLAFDLYQGWRTRITPVAHKITENNFGNVSFSRPNIWNRSKIEIKDTEFCTLCPKAAGITATPI